MPRMLTNAGIIVALLIAPSLAFAAATDVSMDTTVVFTVGGYEVDISGSTATVESVTVNASTLTFGLQSGSSVQITAPNLNALSTDTSADLTVDTCTASLSSLKYTATAARTVTITPSATLCSAGATGTASSGGGNRTTTTPVVPPVVPVVPVTPAAHASGLSAPQIQAILDVLASFNADAATIANVKAALSGTGETTTTTTGSVTSTAVSVFKSNLTTGSLGSEVKMLQEFLNAHGYPVSANGAGSPGKETTTFGAATKAALMKYQKAKGITPAAGYFGAKTRAAINSGQ